MIGAMAQTAWAQCPHCNGVFSQSGEPTEPEHGQLERIHRMAANTAASVAITRLMSEGGRVWDPHRGHGTVTSYWFEPGRGLAGAGITVRWGRRLRSYALDQALAAGMEPDLGTVSRVRSWFAGH